MKYFLLFIAVIIYAEVSYAQNLRVHGTVSDSYSYEAIPGVKVTLSGHNINAETDSLGAFAISNLPAGNYSISFSKIGYTGKIIKISLSSEKEEDLKISLVPHTLQDIYVTSTRYEKNLRDVALPVEVMTAPEIEKTAAFTVSDMLKNKPGIAVQRDGIWGTTVNIRGLSRSAVVTLIDGNRIETATDISAGLSLIDVNNIERIEVIKGAASSLYGTGALGGIVNIISKGAQYSDSFTVGGSLSTGYNSVNKNGFGNLSLNTGSDMWFAHISGSLRDAGNVKTPRGTLSNSQFKDNSFSAGLGVKPFRDNELKVNFQRFYASNVGIPGGGSLFPSAALVTYPTEERNLFSAEYDVRNISKKFLKLSAKYFYQFILRNVENIPNPAGISAFLNGQLVKKAAAWKVTPNARHYTNGIQMQSDWAVAEGNYFIAGIDAWQRQLDSRRERVFLIPAYKANGDSIVGERPLPESRFRSIGIFAQDDIKIIKDRLKVSLGGRFDRIDITNQSTGNPLYRIVNGVRSDVSSSKSTWNAGESKDYSWSGNVDFLYSLTRGINFNFNLARSFRAPSLEERFRYIDQGNVVYMGDPNLKAEDGFSTDAGVRIFNESISFDLDGFLNNMSNMVVDKPATYEGRPAFISSNVGRARLMGFDIKAEYSFLSRYLFYMTASYVSGRDVEKDLYLPQIPPLNGRAGLKVPVWEYADADFSATVFSSQNNTAPGEVKTPGYAYFDLYLNSAPINLGSRNITVFAGIENFTNKAYRNHLASNRGLLNVEPGRNFFLKVNFNW